MTNLISFESIIRDSALTRAATGVAAIGGLNDPKAMAVASFVYRFSSQFFF